MESLISFGLFCLFLLFTSCSKEAGAGTPLSSDSFAVIVNNGYGGGRYKTGDTVHVFANAYAADQVFSNWSGDNALLNDANEWHTWFIMPDKSVNITGNVTSSIPFTLQYEQLKGRDRLKPVYYYFPDGYSGIVYLLHGTGGSAAAIVNGNEWQQIIRDLVSNHLAVIITESEESTIGNDENGDDKIRWNLLPYDSALNVDYANIRIITNTFYNRGMANRMKPRYAIGMSDGGFFSAALSALYHFKAEVQYCSQGSANVLQNTTVPVQFCMARFDNNPEVGIAGNAAALSFSNSLNARGICSRYLVNERSPLYPERFTRGELLTIEQSASVFAELKANGFVNDKNYFNTSPDTLTTALRKNPDKFPVLKNLSLNQKQAVLEQVNIAAAAHHIYSDYDGATVKFLMHQCQ
ncbi:MAG TPA: hypothetical protein VF421_06400 [Niabella sp.]